MTRTLLVPENVISLQFIERWPNLLELISYVPVSGNKQDRTSRRRYRGVIFQSGPSAFIPTNQSPSHLQPAGGHLEKDRWMKGKGWWIITEALSTGRRVTSSFIKRCSFVQRPDPKKGSSVCRLFRLLCGTIHANFGQNLGRCGKRIEKGGVGRELKDRQ